MAVTATDPCFLCIVFSHQGLDIFFFYTSRYEFDISFDLTWQR